MNIDYKKLITFQKDYPELIFQNDGYEYLSLEINEKYKKQIDEISEILKKYIKGFSKFNNFFKLKDGSLSIRCQYDYGFGDPNSIHFIGVGYFSIDDFKDNSK
jgi:hypothetical protein